MQSSFDKEIDVIVSKYRDKFFLKAVQNLKRNLGDHAVTENDVRTRDEQEIYSGINFIPFQLSSVLQKMVQQSSIQYRNCPSIVNNSMFPSADPGSLFDLSDSDCSPENTNTSLPLFNATFQKYSPFPVWKNSATATERNTRKRSSQQSESITDGGGGQGPPATTAPMTSKKQQQKLWSSFDILHSTLTRPSNSKSSFSSSSSNNTTTGQFRSKVTWNTSAVTKDTQFVLDSEANKLFRRTATDLGEYRVAVMHPELIRYTPDNAEDMDWLVGERHVPVALRHSSVQLLVRDEVVRLKRTAKPDWTIGGAGTGGEDAQLVGFKVPEFMIRKMHKYFTELSIRNQKIRTNSGYFDTVMSSSAKEEKNRTNLSTSHATLSALLNSAPEAAAPEN